MHRSDCRPMAVLCRDDIRGCARQAPCGCRLSVLGFAVRRGCPQLRGADIIPAPVQGNLHLAAGYQCMAVLCEASGCARQARGCGREVRGRLNGCVRRRFRRYLQAAGLPAVNAAWEVLLGPRSSGSSVALLAE